MIVIVTGSRDSEQRRGVYLALDRRYKIASERGETLTVRHGDCRVKGKRAGADKYAHEWCAAHPDVIEEPHPADWAAFGKSAGPRRNALMCQLGADEMIAFPLPGPRARSRGTWNCVDIARALRIPVDIQEG
jgi:hypothetical protein